MRRRIRRNQTRQRRNLGKGRKSLRARRGWSSLLVRDALSRLRERPRRGNTEILEPRERPLVVRGTHAMVASLVTKTGGFSKLFSSPRLNVSEWDLNVSEWVVEAA
jgi:hypothetical protein